MGWFGKFPIFIATFVIERIKPTKEDKGDVTDNLRKVFRMRTGTKQSIIHTTYWIEWLQKDFRRVTSMRCDV